jgi:membrane-associated phospholipid phosphatase
MRDRFAWRLGAATLVALGLLLGAAGCGDDEDTAKTETPAKRLSAAGKWKTWVLESGSDVRVQPPPRPGSAAENRDRRRLRDAREKATQEEEQVARSYTRAPVVEPWLEQNIELVAGRPKDVPYSSRAYSNTAVAMYDAMVAASHWQRAYKRKPPAGKSQVPRSAEFSYPSEHAAMAGAASRVLAYLFPEYPKARLEEKAEDASNALVAAGAARPSDVEAGLALGRQVGERVIAHAKKDGAEIEKWDGKRPRGPEHWEPPPGSTGRPNRPEAGRWKTWISDPVSQFRPKPPPKYGSKEFVANAREVMRAKEQLTPSQKRLADFWEGMEGTALPHGIWNRVLIEYVRDKKQSVPEQLRQYALFNVALADAGGAIWNAKFQSGWWDPRPISAIRDLGLDKRWKSYLDPTPLFPAYPSGTSGYSGAAGEMLTYLFPDDAEMWRARAREAGMSRFWGGVHWKIDVNAGLGVGRKVAQGVVKHAKNDGSER